MATNMAWDAQALRLELHEIFADLTVLDLTAIPIRRPSSPDTKKAAQAKYMASPAGKAARDRYEARRGRPTTRAGRRAAL